MPSRMSAMLMLDDLTPYQQAAIETVRRRALNLRSAAQRQIDAVLERQALDPDHLALSRRSCEPVPASVFIFIPSA